MHHVLCVLLHGFLVVSVCLSVLIGDVSLLVSGALCWHGSAYLCVPVMGCILGSVLVCGFGVWVFLSHEPFLFSHYPSSSVDRGTPSVFELQDNDWLGL